ncbi:hypothetical protein WJX81_007311 [Elliptochloris bilobata]|uniref:Core domain-containing protein n=1 Tax=Elliptochloris bilobata TaxID=381761 RepID=A0AAW1QLU8_9CHLO
MFLQRCRPCLLRALALAARNSLLAGVPASEVGSASAEEPVRLTDSAVERLRELLADVAKPGEKMLRLTVEAGGCSGFSYSFNLDAGARDDDLTFERDGVALVVDAVSYEFVRGASVDFVDSLIKSTFEVVENPNSASSCGCGSSFTPKS